MLTPKQNVDLLERTQRTFNLKRLIEQLVEPGAAVMDAGCGSGILSVWAAQAGAEKVLAVDDGDMTLPLQLAEANQCQNAIRFESCDLREVPVPADEPNRFDVLLALVYLNDPRRDLQQMALAHWLATRFVKEGGVMLPDRIVYDMTLAAWPTQHLPSKRGRIERRMRTLEQLYGLNMEPLLKARLDNPDKDDFPSRGADGFLVDDSIKLLSNEAGVLDCRYLESAPPAFPKEVRVQATQDGVVDAVIWRQRLLYGEVLVFQNESVSWAAQPVAVSRGEHAAVQLGEPWMASNCVGVTKG